MKELIAYLNGMSRASQAEFASRCETSVGYLRKASSARQLLGEKLCARIDLESGGMVTRRMLRPNDWAEIWPELANKAEESSHA